MEDGHGLATKVSTKLLAGLPQSDMQLSLSQMLIVH